MKKTIARVLAAALMVSMLSITALAADTILPDSRGLIKASNSSAGSVAKDLTKGIEDETVWLFPANTQFTVVDGIQLGIQSYDGSAFKYVAEVPNGQSFTLETSGTIYEITALDYTVSSYGSSYVMVDDGTGTPTETEETPTQPETPVETVGSFSDVAVDAYYAAPVLWAVENGVTGGTSPTTFSPDATCTQGQILTFLWNAMGQPTPTVDTPFTDVTSQEYYYNAALWAFEMKLVSGDVLSADAPCSRSQIVSYLWALAQKPEPTVQSDFTDVAADAPYAQAVAWALQSGITSGTGENTFSPDATCTRGQVMTFLYSALSDAINLP